MFKTLSRIIPIALIGMTGFALAQAQSTASAPKAKSANTAVATFAGGCFWCMEGPFDALDGVISTTSGYIGGSKKDPSYQEVSSGGTGHTEAVRIVYDPAKVTYEKLLGVFWRNIDPTVKDRQFCDSGSQYRSGIFYHDDAQKKAADDSKAALDKSRPFKGAIVTEITAASAFYAAEEYHQDYYLKNPVRYRFYRQGCGRDARLKELWAATPGTDVASRRGWGIDSSSHSNRRRDHEYKIHRFIAGDGGCVADAGLRRACAHAS